MATRQTPQADRSVSGQSGKLTIPDKDVELPAVLDNVQPHEILGLAALAILARARYWVGL